MITIGDVLTDWQKAQIRVTAARDQWKRTGHHTDLTEYVNAVEDRDNTPFQPSLMD